ncbi:hypothetical protein PT85_01530 [Pseudomonas flexibilis]|uniref:Uncharacterized protein n=1 Tax=Pseudomonas flexibilis TaxID=706570 RepID=A0A0B3BUG3_9PSED|nr:hypothetical protein PT85_01530 [Pseudomonas flexibilis]
MIRNTLQALDQFQGGHLYCIFNPGKHLSNTKIVIETVNRASEMSLTHLFILIKVGFTKYSPDVRSHVFLIIFTMRRNQSTPQMTQACQFSAHAIWQTRPFPITAQIIQITRHEVLLNFIKQRPIRKNIISSKTKNQRFIFIF